MGQDQKRQAVEKYLKEKYGSQIKINILAEIGQSWGMISDDFEVSIQNTAEGEKHLAVYVKETETECRVINVFDRTELKKPEPILKGSAAECGEAAGEIETGDVPALDQWQLERLCNIVYLDHILKGQGLTLENIIKILRNQIKKEPLPCEMGKQEWEWVLNSIDSDSVMKELVMLDFQEVKKKEEIAGQTVLPGQRVVCFRDSKNRVYVIYRGTYGAEEWRDNANGMIEQDTIQQKAALAYLMSVKENHKPDYIAVAGHSKGGNKAQYVTLTAPGDIVNYGLSIDGQGFSLKFLDYYADNIKKRGQLHLIADQRDFVNCLGFYLNSVPGCASKATTFYRGWRGFWKVENNMFGSPFTHFHCPDALRLRNNKIAPGCGSGEIPLMVNDLLTYFLSESGIPDDEKQKVARIIVSLMTEEPSSLQEIIWAAIKLIEVAGNLFIKDYNFSQRLQNILYLENDVIFATFTQKNKCVNQTLEKVEVIEFDPQKLIIIVEIVMGILKFILTIMKPEDVWKHIKDFGLAIWYRGMEYSGFALNIYLLVSFIIAIVSKIFSSPEHQIAIGKLWEGKEDETKLQFREMRASLDYISEDKVGAVEKPYLEKTKEMMDEIIAKF